MHTLRPHARPRDSAAEGGPSPPPGEYCTVKPALQYHTNPGGLPELRTEPKKILRYCTQSQVFVNQNLPQGAARDASRCGMVPMLRDCWPA